MMPPGQNIANAAQPKQTEMIRCLPFLSSSGEDDDEDMYVGLYDCMYC
jgi:hypothetical protein